MGGRSWRGMDSQHLLGPMKVIIEGIGNIGNYIMDCKLYWDCDGKLNMFVVRVGFIL